MHEHTNGRDIIIHRILLSRNDLHTREGVKHDLEKSFLVVKEYRKNTTLLFNLHYISPKTAFHIAKDRLLHCKRPHFTLQKVIY